jgi:hypothetical protein
MGWKRTWNDWMPVAMAAGLCLGAFLLNAGAWQAGYRASWSALGGCNMLRIPLLLLAWVAVFSVFEGAARTEKPAGPSAGSVLRNIGLFLLVPACFSCQFLWTLVLLVLTAAVVALFSVRKDASPTTWKWTVLRFVLVSLLFTLTWYLCASTTRQALHGLGVRIADKGVEDRLRDWAAEVIAAVKQGRHHYRYTYDEVPDFVDDLMGPIPGWPIVHVDTYAQDPYIAIANGSGYAFQITICPSCIAQKPQPWWVPEWTRLEWRPGIYLETAGR